MHKYLLLFLILLSSFIAYAQVSDHKNIQNRINKIEKSYKKVAKIIDKGDLSTDSLKSLNQNLIAYRDSLFNISALLNKEINNANLDLTNLGPAPKEGDPSEPENVAKRRKEINNQITAVTGLSSSANVLLSDIGDSMKQISTQRNSIFLSGITDRSLSPFTPDIWKDARKEQKELNENLSNYYSKNWSTFLKEDKMKINMILLLLSLFVAVFILILPRKAFSKKLMDAYKIKSENPKMDAQLHIILGPIFRFIIIFCALYVVYLGSLEVGLITKDTKGFYMKLITGISFSVFIWNYAKNVFVADTPILNKVVCVSGKEKQVRFLFVGIFIVFIINRIIIAGFGVANSGMKLYLIQTMVLTGVFAILFYLFFATRLWKLSSDSSSATSKDATKETGDENPDDRKNRLTFEFIHYLGRIIAVFIFLAIFLEYARLANFVFHRIVLIAVFYIGFTSVRTLGKWVIYRLTSAGKNFSASDSKTNTIADTKGKNVTINFWLDTIFDGVLFIFSVPAFLYVFGLGWIDINSWLDYLSTGFKIGAITISFKNIFTGIFVFVIIILSTRWATSMINARLIEYSNMDSGLRNSMITILNYIGIFIAIFTAFPILGFNFSKLAVIAGALSVGIGFGLQNIVKDFVSGIILLVERPIKIGDWVVVDAGEGYVKEIRGRVTIIQGFDLSMIIVPNSELVTSPVQNLFYKNKRGRVTVAVRVDFASDPEQVKEILLKCASENKMVVVSPQSYVIWNDFGESALEFELRAFIKNSDYGLTVKSDLRFAIFKKFKEAGITIPFPQNDLHIKGEEKNLIETKKTIKASTKAKSKNPTPLTKTPKKASVSKSAKGPHPSITKGD